MNILAFGASSSRESINQQFAHYAAQQFEGDVNLIDLNDFDMPLFSVDREKEKGVSRKANDFLSIIESADLIVISVAEHNGNVTAAFKNVFDWVSRINVNLFQDKPMFLLSTSPGAFGGGNAMAIALARFPKHGAKILSHFSLPSFATNFDAGITDEVLKAAFLKTVEEVKKGLK